MCAELVPWNISNHVPSLKHQNEKYFKCYWGLYIVQHISHHTFHITINNINKLQSIDLFNWTWGWGAALNYISLTLQILLYVPSIQMLYKASHAVKTITSTLQGSCLCSQECWLQIFYHSISNNIHTITNFRHFS